MYGKANQIKYINIKGVSFDVKGIFNTGEIFNEKTKKRYHLTINKKGNYEKDTLVALLMNPSNAMPYSTDNPNKSIIADETVINLIKYSKYKTIHIINTMPNIGAKPSEYLKNIRSLNDLRKDCNENKERVKQFIQALSDSRFDLLLGSGKYKLANPKDLKLDKRELFREYKDVRRESYNDIMDFVLDKASNIVVADLNKREKGEKYITGTHPLAVQRKQKKYRICNKNSKNHEEIFKNLEKVEKTYILLD